MLERCSNHTEETNGERKALLEKAAYNFEFARNYLKDYPQLLWLEGTALALVGKYDSAIDRFQKLEVARFSEAHKDYAGSLRAQAKYNRAVLLALCGKGDLCRAMSVCDELLGSEDIPDPIRWLAGLCKLMVIAGYDQEAWKHFDQQTAAGWLNEGDELLEQVTGAKANQQMQPSLQDQLTLDFIALETKRALGKCSLRFAEAFLAEDVLKNGRPVRRTNQNDQLVGPTVSRPLEGRLNAAFDYLEGCGDDADLLADRAYIKLLLGKYTEAEEYAYQATRWNADSERAYYLAAEACYCHGGAEAQKRARQYASAYYTKLQGSLTPPATPEPDMAAFGALWADLKIKGDLANTSVKSAAA